MDFYAAASQLLPLLFLAMVFQTRVLDRQPSSYRPDKPDDPSHWNITQAITRMYAAVLMAAGEIFALLVLYSGEPTGLANGVVWAAIVAGLYGTTAPLLTRQWGYVTKWWATDARAEWWLSALIVLALIILTSTWIGWFL